MKTTKTATIVVTGDHNNHDINLYDFKNKDNFDSCTNGNDDDEGKEEEEERKKEFTLLAISFMASH